MKYLVILNSMKAAVLLLVSFCGICKAQESPCSYVERHRSFPEIEEVDQVERKKGLIVNTIGQQPIYLKDIIQAGSAFKSENKNDLFLVFGYLWDAEIHLRCLAYVILANNLQLKDRLPPIRILQKIGTAEFEQLSKNIITEISKKP